MCNSLYLHQVTTATKKCKCSETSGCGCVEQVHSMNMYTVVVTVLFSPVYVYRKQPCMAALSGSTSQWVWSE